MISETESIVPYGDTWRLWKGTAEPAPQPPDWFAPEFVETTWTNTRLPASAGSVGIGGTILRDMRGSYTTVYLRKTFVLADLPGINRFTCHVRASDGFVLWINGVEIARADAPPGRLSHTNIAPSNGASLFQFIDVPVDNLDAVLRNGTNQLAVLGLSGALNDPVFVIDASVDLERDRTPPIIDRTAPEAGSVVQRLTRFEILTSEAVKGVDAADLLVNGVAATNVVVVAPDDYVFEFPNPADGPVTLALRPDHGIQDLSRLDRKSVV